MWNRANLVEALMQLGEREFIETIQEVLQTKADDRDFAGGDFEYDRWCLACTSYGAFRGQLDEEPYVQLIGACAPEVAHVDWEHLCQDGKCPKCGTLVLSVAKLALCPVCSTEVECT